METKVAVYQPHQLDKTHIVVYQERDDGTLRVFMPMAEADGSVVWRWEEVAPAQAPPASFVVPRVLEVQGGVLQQLTERLAEQGIWPKGMDAKKEEVARLESHLADLQRLVFDGDWVELQRGRPQAQLVEGGAADAKV